MRYYCKFKEKFSAILKNIASHSLILDFVYAHRAGWNGQIGSVWLPWKTFVYAILFWVKTGSEITLRVVKTIRGCVAVVAKLNLFYDLISYVFETNEFTGKNVKMLFGIELLLWYLLAVLEQIILVLFYEKIGLKRETEKKIKHQKRILNQNSKTSKLIWSDWKTNENKAKIINGLTVKWRILIYRSFCYF